MNKFELIQEFIINKRKLPHWQNPGSVYFITFRTNKLILNDKHRDIIKSVISFHNNTKYELYTFVIMPDHVHIILKPNQINDTSYYNLSEILHSIKSYSANEINKLDKIKKRKVWQIESFDRLIRDDEELLEKMIYIKNNPIKKDLVSNIEEYPWYYLDYHL